MRRRSRQKYRIQPCHHRALPLQLAGKCCIAHKYVFYSFQNFFTPWFLHKSFVSSTWETIKNTIIQPHSFFGFKTHVGCWWNLWLSHTVCQRSIYPFYIVSYSIKLLLGHIVFKNSKCPPKKTNFVNCTYLHHFFYKQLTNWYYFRQIFLIKNILFWKI